MYDNPNLGIKEMMSILGVGRNTMLRWCQTRPYGLPVVNTGKKYQADRDKLMAWRDRWYAGEFSMEGK